MRWPDLFGWRADKEREAAQVGAISERVKAMSAEEARSLADALLRNPEKFELTPLANPLPDQITGVVRQAFEAYGNIFGALQFSENEFGPSELLPNHFRIGYDMDFTEFVVRPGSDEVMWLESEAHPGSVLTTWPTIYHCIVEMDLLSNRQP